MPGFSTIVLFPLAVLVLVTGGARSGKSRVAEQRLAELAEPPWTYLATGEGLDDEMRERIRRHQSRRGAEWRTEEAPRDPARIFSTNVRAILLDCLTLWLSNRLLDGLSDDEIFGEADQLVTAAQKVPVVVMVTNEVGAGLVPENPLGRRFRDLAGWVNQRVAAAADEVVLVACGLPLKLK
jgi:adenosylcobinamide kinase/adenosylcobinamide-phosphate guanylyltransferase